MARGRTALIPRNAPASEDLLDTLDGPASSFEKIEAILTSPITYVLADVLPDKPRAGRPRDFPKYMWVVFHALVNYVWGSARGVETELGHEVVWRFIRRTIKRRFPDDPDMWLRKKPMRRWHYQRALVYLRDPKIFEELRTVGRREAATLATGLGLFDPDSPIAWTNPHPDRFLRGDGTVIPPLYRSENGRRLDRTTGEIRQGRYDPDASLHTVGGGKKVFGINHVLFSALAGTDWVLLDFESVPRKGGGGEAGMAMRCMRRLRPLLPGAQGAVFDKALRGVHIDRAMRDLGWIAVTGIHALTDRQTGPRDWHIEDWVPRQPSVAENVISIYAREGAAGHRELTETGEPVFIPWRRVRTMRRGRPGAFRFYNTYSMPTQGRDTPVLLRLTGNEEDARRQLNRSEHLRAYPSSDPAYARVMPKRNNAETLNSTLKRTLPGRRAHSLGRVAQEADLLGFQLGLNALADHRQRKRKAAATAA
jgi:hypothetical protein